MGGGGTGCEVFLPVTVVALFHPPVAAISIPNDFFPSCHVALLGEKSPNQQAPWFPLPEGPGAEGSQGGVMESGVRAGGDSSSA